ncbi:MAG TPA: hypothetical protein DCE78_12115 [Bacteroidetes bacterium]|nr:hypothetical protein [Bacteroidota bacterium]
MKRFPELLLTVLTVILISGCNNTFEPLQENTKYVFSMYGALDVHADTQWVRVMPIGDRLFNENPEPNGTIVTLERLSTGDVITLNDSLFAFGGPSYLWNYWTTEPLFSLEPYKLTATTPDGRTSSATVLTTAPLPDPIIEYNNTLQRGNVDGQNEGRLVVARINFYIQVIDDLGRIGDEYLESISVLDTAYRNYNTQTYRFTFESRSLLTRRVGVPASRIIINRIFVQVGSGLVDWPSYSGLLEEEIVMPDVVTNVENGTGYVATVSSKIIQVQR